MAGLHQDEASVPRRIFGKAGSDNRKSDLSSLENTVPHIVQPIYRGVETHQRTVQTRLNMIRKF